MITPEDHERLREDLAGYVLGGLTVDEQHAVEAHLAGCTACRAELSELDPIPVLLELATPDGLDAAVPGAIPAAVGTMPAPIMSTAIEDGATLSPSTSGATPIARRRGRTLVGATVGVMAVLAAFLVGLSIATPTDPAYGTPIALHAPAGSAAAGSVAVRADTHGTDVHLAVQHLSTAKGVWYECLWWSASGTQWSAGTFKAGTGLTQVDLRTAAGLHPGWRLAVLEHVTGRTAGATVLETST